MSGNSDEGADVVLKIETENPSSDAPIVTVLNPPNPIGAVISAAIMGAVFGTTFAKSHVYEPAIIRDQFLFKRWIMLKMFLGAMGVGAICLSILSKLVPTYFEAARKMWEGTSRERGWLTGSVLGCAILGAGMATAGACPGMVLSQVGSAVPNSGITLGGGLLGAFVYGLLQPTISANILKKGPQGPESVYIDRMMGRPYWILSLMLGIGCVVAAVLFEVFIPFKDELPARLAAQMQTCSDLFSCPAWPPAVAGGILGLMQVPALVMVRTFLGSATSYQVSCSWWVNLGSDQLQRLLPYMSQMGKPRVATWWQLPYVGMAVIASLLWAVAVDDLGYSVGADSVSALLGGFLMVFGARWAGGCTSGHGISGCAILMAHSFLAVGAMFGAGIATAFIWNAIGGFQLVTGF